MWALPRRTSEWSSLRSFSLRQTTYFLYMEILCVLASCRRDYTSSFNHATKLWQKTRLYLPEGWANDPGRRERSHVRQGVIFRSKPHIALSFSRSLREWEVPCEVVADSGYGKYPLFLGGL